MSLTWEIPGARRVRQDEQGLADLRDEDPTESGDGRVEDGHGGDAVRSKIGGSMLLRDRGSNTKARLGLGTVEGGIDDRDWDTHGGMIEFDLFQDGDGDGDGNGDGQLRIWIGDQRQKP